MLAIAAGFAARLSNPDAGRFCRGSVRGNENRRDRHQLSRPRYDHRLRRPAVDHRRDCLLRRPTATGSVTAVLHDHRRCHFNCGHHRHGSARRRRYFFQLQHQSHWPIRKRRRLSWPIPTLRQWASTRTSAARLRTSRASARLTPEQAAGPSPGISIPSVDGTTLTAFGGTNSSPNTALGIFTRTGSEPDHATIASTATLGPRGHRGISPDFSQPENGPLRPGYFREQRGLWRI